MSTDDNADGYSNVADEVETTVEKNVLVTAYAGPDADFEDRRDFLAEVFDDELDIDPHATTTREKTDVTLELDYEGYDPDWEHDEQTTTSVDLSYSDKRVIKHAIENDDIDTDAVDWVDITVSEYESEEHDNSLNEIISNGLGQQIDTGLPVDGFERDNYSVWLLSFTRERDASNTLAGPDETIDDSVRVNARYTDVEQRRMLLPQDEREADNKFVDDDERWSMQVSVDIEAATQDEVDEIEKYLGSHVVSALTASPVIEATRVTDCEKTTTAKGACYDV